MTIATLMPITDGEFKQLRELIYARCGIDVTEKKRSLLVVRLQKVVRARGFDDFSTYCDQVEEDSDGELLDELVNKISTNFTYFWREPDHFEHFRDVAMPDLCGRLKKLRSHDLRIWCAAAATGEEPYMLAMMLREALGENFGQWESGLLATDISQRALGLAIQGFFQERALAKLPASLKKKYFRKSGADGWEVDSSLKSDVTFRRFNLMNVLPFKVPFHAVFCRNVMIYFNTETRDRLVQKLHDHTVPGGYLYVGHSESIGRDNCPYDYVQPGVYRRKLGI